MNVKRSIAIPAEMVQGKQELSSGGFTLIEMIVLIMVIGITAIGSLIAFNTVLSSSNQPGQVLKAVQLAHARMEIIVQQRWVNGFSGISDPCVSAHPPAACAVLAAFASNEGLAVTSSITAPSYDVRLASVSVTGVGQATVVTRFAS